jgi:hypothetical protein
MMAIQIPLYAQTDTVRVLSDFDTASEGNLNKAIAAVITADSTGYKLTHTVFKLEPYGYYILTGAITVPPHAHLTIVADLPGMTQGTAPPMMLWSSSGGVQTGFNFRCYGDITLKNVWLLYANTAGAQVSSSLQIEDDSAANASGKGEIAVFEDVIFDYAPRSPNGGGVVCVAARHFKGEFKNCYFRNCVDPRNQKFGAAVSFSSLPEDPNHHIDVLFFENCTFADIGSVLLQELPHWTDLVWFNHCTFVNTMMNTPGWSYWWNLVVANCVYANAWLYGDIPSQDGAAMNPNGGMVNVDSVATSGFMVPFTDSASAPAALQRHILISNNSYVHDQWYIDFLPHNAYNDTASENNKIHLMPAMSGKTYRYFFAPEVKTNFPYMRMANIHPSSIDADTTRGFNDPAADPGFLLNPCNIDSIKAFLLGRWATGTNVNWAYDPASDIQQGWPMNEDLSYTNTTLKTAAMGGFPLGDLYHWWPTQYAAWSGRGASDNYEICSWFGEPYCDCCPPDFEAPAAPQLVSPRSIINVGRKTTFTWLSSSSARQYHLQVATDGTFAAIVLDTIIAGASLTLTDELEANTKYYWRVGAINTAGEGNYSAVAYFTTGVRDDVENEISKIPKNYALRQNYPNPFNPKTVISYQLPVMSRVSLKVYDMLGEEVATLFDGLRQAGYYDVIFDGIRLASGVYFYRIQAGSFAQTKKLVLLK